MKKIYSGFILILSAGLSSCGGDGSGAARIVIGDSNTLFALNELQYQNPYVIQVTDIEGNPAANVAVSIVVRATAYRTGFYSNGSGLWVQQIAQECVAEDKNNNAVLDPGEDVNGSGRIEPSNTSTVSAHPTLTPTLTPNLNTVVTDESGFGYFALTYPKSEAIWSRFEITATAKVSGSEGESFLSGILPVLAADLEDIDIEPPGGVTGAYGATSNCEEVVP
ncbi:hypothetical protein MNBD_GAMMA08-714 [hydrothermal vent metagenome]|uniref:Lipoprotein n=1 Tax=hydrothermal vent metagenome TaxID=652676 RepID=A0A3B0XC41_9ZZZZ